MEEVRQLIDQLDQPGGETVNEIRVFKLKYSLAPTLAPVLQRAVRGEGTRHGRRAGTTTDGPRHAAADGHHRRRRGGRSSIPACWPACTVNADTRANALVVSAPPESMPLMAALIEQLDQPPDAIAELKVFTIKNGDAVSLADMLQDLFGAPQAGGGGGGGGGRRRRRRGQQRAARSSSSASPSTSAPTASSPPAASDELLVVEAILFAARRRRKPQPPQQRLPAQERLGPGRRLRAAGLAPAQTRGRADGPRRHQPVRATRTRGRRRRRNRQQQPHRLRHAGVLQGARRASSSSSTSRRRWS